MKVGRGLNLDLAGLTGKWTKLPPLPLTASGKGDNHRQFSCVKQHLNPKNTRTHTPALFLYSQWPVTERYNQPPSWPVWRSCPPGAPGCFQCASSAFQTSPAPSLLQPHAAERPHNNTNYTSVTHLSPRVFTTTSLYFFSHSMGNERVNAYSRGMNTIYMAKVGFILLKLLISRQVTQTRWGKISLSSRNSFVSWCYLECQNYSLRAESIRSPPHKQDTPT